MSDIDRHANPLLEPEFPLRLSENRKVRDFAKRYLTSDLLGLSSLVND